MVFNSIGLFFRGKLFADTGKAVLQMMAGVLVAALIVIVVARLTGFVWLAGLLGGLTGGAVMPVLFKNLKYR